jgi:hypothetical protein
MPIRFFYNPANPKQQYQTMTPDDPNVPAGWLDTQGSDGAIPEALKQFTAGVNNQGAGATGYLANADGDPAMRLVAPHWPNGILNGPDYSVAWTVQGHGYGQGAYGATSYNADVIATATPIL